MINSLVTPQLNLLLGSISGAFVVICGGLYALSFAFYRLTSQPIYKWAARASYLLLLVALCLLIVALKLTNEWISVVIIMVAGYWIAPRIIWYLCVQTHQEHTEHE